MADSWAGSQRFRKEFGNMKKKKLKVGDRVFSKYFDAWLTIIAIEDDNNWYFRHPVNRAITKAQTPLSYFEKQNETTI